MATDDLKARMADVATFGYMPAAARLALQQGVKRIEALEAQLAGKDEQWAEKLVRRIDENEELRAQLAARDAEIGAWLRGEVAYELAANSEHDDLLKLADAIERGLIAQEVDPLLIEAREIAARVCEGWVQKPDPFDVNNYREGVHDDEPEIAFILAKLAKPELTRDMVREAVSSLGRAIDCMPSHEIAARIHVHITAALTEGQSK